MFERLERLFELVDESVAKLYEAYPDEVKCKKGCADCCHAVFDISFIEAAYIAKHLRVHPEILQQGQERAKEAALAFEKLMAQSGDVATARIRCPLLADDDTCLAHGVRPVNCRTYGTPTIIHDKAHVCGLSGFAKEKKYQSIDLAPIQQELCDCSVELVGEDFGIKRFPVSWVFLKLDFFLPPE